MLNNPQTFTNSNHADIISNKEEIYTLTLEKRPTFYSCETQDEKLEVLSYCFTEIGRGLKRKYIAITSLTNYTDKGPVKSTFFQI